MVMIITGISIYISFQDQAYSAICKAITHNNDQGFLWRYAPVRRTCTFFPSKEKQLFLMYIIKE